MDRVSDRLYVSDAASAHMLDMLSSRGITHVVSIGCAPNVSEDFVRRFTCLAVPHVLDKPETFVLPALQLCARFIDSAMAADSGNAVLVHCVYGQSRSISVVVAYLLMCAGSAYTVHEALAHVRDVRQRAGRPISVNPGFLAQLHLLHSARGGFESAECKLLCSSLCQADTLVAPATDCAMAEVATETGVRYCLYGRDSSSIQLALTPSASPGRSQPAKTHACRHCGAALFDELAVLGACGDSYVKSEGAFVQAFIDDFWRDYRSAGQSKRGATAAVDSTEGGGIKLSALGGALAVRDGDGSCVDCISCGSAVGAFAAGGLQLCGGFLLADLIEVHLPEAAAAGGRGRKRRNK